MIIRSPPATGWIKPPRRELLLDLQAYGWVSRVDFAGTGGWTLTDTGRRRNEQQLAAELAAAGAAADVAAVHRDFLPSNARLLRASTDWQLRPSASDPLAPNRHDDPDWDARVIDDLTRIGDGAGRAGAATDLRG